MLVMHLSKLVDSTLIVCQFHCDFSPQEIFNKYLTLVNNIYVKTLTYFIMLCMSLLVIIFLNFVKFSSLYVYFTTGAYYGKFKHTEKSKRRNKTPSQLKKNREF